MLTSIVRHSDFDLSVINVDLNSKHPTYSTDLVTISIIIVQLSYLFMIFPGKFSANIHYSLYYDVTNILVILTKTDEIVHATEQPTHRGSNQSNYSLLKYPANN